MTSISSSRLQALLAAEAVCQQLRADIAEAGGMTKRTWPHFDRWMRKASKRAKYGTPKRPYPVWCSSCKRKHVCGECA